MGRLFSLTYPTPTVLPAIRNRHRYGSDPLDPTGPPAGTLSRLPRRR